MEERKTCTGCGEDLLITSYYQSKGRTHSQCKDCIKAKQLAIRQLEPGYRPRVPPRDEFTKTCPKCLARKAIEHFVRPRSGAIGTYCHPCQTARDREAKRRLAETIERQRKERYARPVDPIEMRRCPRCGETKARAEFSSRGKGGYCKPCNAEYSRNWNAKKRDAKRFEQYGYTPAMFAALLEKQGGGCAICGRTDTTNGRWTSEHAKDLHVDHDHTTGEVRGLLCNCCNVALGFMNDDPDRLIQAAEYLKNPPAQ